jgi:hypothetical protein
LKLRVAGVLAYLWNVWSAVRRWFGTGSVGDGRKVSHSDGLASADTLGWPLPRARRGGDGGPFQPAPVVSGKDPARSGTTYHRLAFEPPLGAGENRVLAGHAPLQGSQGPVPIPSKLGCITTITIEATPHSEVNASSWRAEPERPRSPSRIGIGRLTDLLGSGSPSRVPSGHTTRWSLITSSARGCLVCRGVSGNRAGTSFLDLTACTLTPIRQFPTCPSAPEHCCDMRGQGRHALLKPGVLNDSRLGRSPSGRQPPPARGSNKLPGLLMIYVQAPGAGSAWASPSSISPAGTN